MKANTILLTSFFIFFMILSVRTWADQGVVSGRLAMDANLYNSMFLTGQSERRLDNPNNLYVDYELREAKLALDYVFSKSWDFEFEVAASTQSFEQEASVELEDAWVRWKGQDKVWEIKVGKMKEPVGHERQIGLTDSLFVERSMVTSIFSPGRSIGLMSNYYKKSFSASLGGFSIEPEEQSNMSDQNGNALSARLTKLFELDQWDIRERPKIHLGGSLSYRQFNHSMFQLEERGEVRTADNIIRGAKFFADEQSIGQIELGVKWSPLWIMSEFYESKTKDSSGRVWDYDGFYVQGAIGAEVNYKRGKYKLNNKLQHPWLLTFRYSELNLRDRGIGTKANNLTLGVNYQWSKDIKLLLNFLISSAQGDVLSRDVEGQALTALVYFDF